MLLTLLSTLSFQHNSRVYGMMATAAHRTSSSSITNGAYPSPGSALRGPSSRQNIGGDVFPLLRNQRKLGTRFQRCGDSVVFCLISEVCTESGSPSMFTCKHKEATLATASSPVLSPTSSPAAVEAPVAVSKYWDDPKANSTTVVVSRSKYSGEVNAIEYGLEGATTFDNNILIGICLGVAALGVVSCCIKCYHEQRKGKDSDEQIFDP